MAIAARQVQVTVGDDHAVAIQKEIVVDHELGIAAEVEKKAIAVNLGDGNIGVITQQKVVGVQVTKPQRQQRTQVVRQQPVVTQTTVKEKPWDSVFLFALFALFINCFCCWWGFVCSCPALVFAVNAETAEEQGDTSTAGTNKALSVICSVVAIVSGLIGLAVVIAVIAIRF